jgi:NAD(P)H-flavin reductase/ferredoxin/truncated hemoglobin YjbI
MPLLSYKKQIYRCRDDETVLDAFLRQGVNIPFSCRKGVCHVCVRQCREGQIPEAAQAGIKPELQRKGYFLPCLCEPESDMDIAPPETGDLYIPAIVQHKEMLSANVCRLLLESSRVIDYRPGQFINLRRKEDGLNRSYSLSSIPQEDYFLELHVKRMPGGNLSNWIFDTLQTGEEIDIQGPLGDNHYRSGKPDQSMLIVAGGTGLAPMLGVLRDAVLQGHRGEIYIYHGSNTVDDIYLYEDMIELAGEWPNVHYNATLSSDEADKPNGMLRGQVNEIAFSLHEQLVGWKVYLAGSPQLVHEAMRLARNAGVDECDIHADPFEFKDLRNKPTRGHEPDRRRISNRPRSTANIDNAGYPSPDLELWNALENGDLLHKILKDFYDCVYDDASLAPFFDGVTKRRLIEKQYLFLRQIMTGEKIYFGDRPRNAHHWMVISDELFDHRTSLLEAAIRKHGLSEPLVTRWCEMEEFFRSDIVKDQPRKKVVNGVELPLEGFDELVLDFGTLCDSCGSEIAMGTKIRYHVRLGSTYCPVCMDTSSEQGI